MAGRSLLTLTLLLLAGCASSTRSTPPLEVTARDYAPYAIGATWSYAVSYPGQQGEMTVRIVGEKDGYWIDDRDNAYRHTPDGLRDKQRYMIKNPAAPGTEWKVVLSASAIEHYKIESAGEPCESQAGPFPDCLVVESWIRRDANVTLRARFTWARGVGLVKLETEADVAGKGKIPQVKQSLVRYSLKGGAPSADRPTAPDETAPENWTRPR